MRLFLAVILLSFISVCAPAFAQDDKEDSGRRFYGNSRSNSAAPIFVPSGVASSGSGPISIKQLMQNNQSAADGSRRSYGGSSDFIPYGTKSNNYSLSVTPDDVRASRARREAYYKEQEDLRKKEEKEQERRNQLASQKGNYLSKFQNVGGGARPATITRKPVYKSNRLGLKEPPKVFNSVY